VEQLERSITALDTEVDPVIAPFAQASDRLDTITGVGKRAAESMIAEIGVDMSVFPPPPTWTPGLGAARATTAPVASAAPARPPRAAAGLVRC
jgi:hypothetical protein